MVWLLVGEPTETSDWCDEHALPHVVTFPIHGLAVGGVTLNIATVTRCLVDEGEGG